MRKMSGGIESTYAIGVESSRMSFCATVDVGSRLWTLAAYEAP